MSCWQAFVVFEGAFYTRARSIPFSLSVTKFFSNIIGERAKQAKQARRYLVMFMETRDYYNWASEASPTLGCSIEISRDIGECGSTHYVGLSGIVRNLIQKSTV